ncbi:hypothetical protein KAR91_69505 [Candidatus Pacearchaeota archaeon]|nr:hypothetical protein [Candidatus Pacearchaeota archaeon]
MTLTKKQLFLADSGDEVIEMISDSNRVATGNVITRWLARWNGTNAAKIEAQAGTDTTNKDEAELAFFTSNGGVLAEVFRLLQNGDAKIVNGNLIFVAGKGLDFSASEGGGASSSIFDDYEEGDFTPFLFGRTIAGTPDIVTEEGKYTKIGDTVFWSAVTSYNHPFTVDPTGQLAMGGLPFNVGSGNNQAGDAPYITGFTTTYDSITSLHVQNSDEVWLYRMEYGGGTVASYQIILSGGNVLFYSEGHYKI